MNFDGLRIDADQINTDELYIGGTQASLSATELNVLDGVTAGTVTASKAAVVDSNKDIADFRNVGLTGTLTFGVGGQINADSGTGTASSGAVTVSKMAGVITSESLTTTAGNAATITVTNTLVAATDLIFVTQVGGTNSAGTPIIKAVPGSGSFVITLDNKHASAAFNGTFILAFLVVKA